MVLRQHRFTSEGALRCLLDVVSVRGVLRPPGIDPRALIQHHEYLPPSAGYDPRHMRIYTRKGDTGTTGLLYGGDRISKADLRTDAYGTTDEAVSALGLARAALAGGPLTELI